MENKFYLIGLIVFVFSLVSLIFLSSFWFYDSILKESIYSVQNSCGIISDEEFEERGIYTLGDVILVKSDNGTLEPKIRIYIDEDSEAFDDILTHELCHVKQFYKDRRYLCDKPMRMLLNEIECKIKGKI